MRRVARDRQAATNCVDGAPGTTALLANAKNGHDFEHDKDSGGRRGFPQAARSWASCAPLAGISGADAAADIARTLNRVARRPWFQFLDFAG